jgi:hypothetical protein
MIYAINQCQIIARRGFGVHVLKRDDKRISFSRSVIFFWQVFGDLFNSNGFC